MQQYSVGKGRKRQVRKFRAKEGLWILGPLTLLLLLILLSMVLGFLHVDAD